MVIEKRNSTSTSREVAYLIFVIFCTPPHFLVGKFYARKVRKFAFFFFFATKQRKLILAVLTVLVGVLAALVGVLDVFCNGMVYLLHEMEHSELGTVYLVFSKNKCED